MGDNVKTQPIKMPVSVMTKPLMYKIVVECISLLHKTIMVRIFPTRPATAMGGRITPHRMNMTSFVSSLFWSLIDELP